MMNVNIVKLAPMRVASTHAFSETPERDAWGKLRAWAKPKGLLEDSDKHPIFGFNNPNPSKDRKEYGYEFWIAVNPDIQAESDIAIKNFSGGLYAVTTCKLIGDPEGTIQEKWMRLWNWVQASQYQWRKTHELEKVHDLSAPEQDLVVDLYLPIEAI
jgi:DNA gyrase inhibitor GyrI